MHAACKGKMLRRRALPLLQHADSLPEMAAKTTERAMRTRMGQARILDGGHERQRSVVRQSIIFRKIYSVSWTRRDIVSGGRFGDESSGLEVIVQGIVRRKRKALSRLPMNCSQRILLRGLGCAWKTARHSCCARIGELGGRRPEGQDAIGDRAVDL